MVRKSNIVSVGVKGGRRMRGGGQLSNYYNSMSWASSSEKSDMELSDEESPAPSSCSFRASSVAYFWMYSRGKDKSFFTRLFFCGGSYWQLGRQTFDFLLVLLRPMEVHGCCVAVQGVDGVWVSKQLGQKRLKDVGQI